MTSTKSRGRVRISDIASELGVSQSTVSRALAGHPAISEATRAKVVSLAQRLDYPARTPRQVAPTPKGREKIIGVVVAALHNQFYVHLLDRLHEELKAFGYHVTLIIDSLADHKDFTAFETLFREFLDGIIFTTASTDPKMADVLRETGVPVVLAVRAIDGLPFDTVEVDNLVAGGEAARHLYELGHRNIGFVMGPRDISTSRDRHAGARRYLESKGVEVRDELTTWGMFTHGSGYSSLLNLMAKSDPPTAVVCGNDTIAIGVLEAAARHAIDVPRELSVIGFDDIPSAGWEMVRLTTIRQPIAEMAATAARRIVERIKSGDHAPPRHDVLPVSLIARHTTAAPARPGQNRRSAQP